MVSRSRLKRRMDAQGKAVRVGLEILFFLAIWLIAQVCRGQEYELVSVDSGHSLVATESPLSLIGEKPAKKRFRVLMGTENWCGPCATFKSIEIPKLKAVGWTVGDETCHIQYISQEESAKRGYGSIPSFIVLDNDKQISGSSGYMSATQFSEWFNSVVKPKPTGSLTAAVNPSEHWTFPGDGVEDLIRHLAAENHGYDIKQLRQMTALQLYQLHDRDHQTGRVRRSSVSRRALGGILGGLFQ